MTGDGVDLEFLAQARLEYAARTSLAAMPEDIKAEALAWCRLKGDYRVRPIRQPDGSVVLWWGGGPLALVDADALTEESLTRHGIDGEEVQP